MTEQVETAPVEEAVKDAVQPTTEEATSVDTQGQPEQGQQTDESEAPQDGGEKPDQEKTPSQLRAERRRAEMQRLREGEAQAKQRLEAIKEAAKGVAEPVRESFDDPDEYVAAKAAYSAAAAIRDQDVQRATGEIQENEARQKAAAADAWKDQVEDAKTRHSDFEAVAYNPNVPYSDAMTQAVTTAENGADVAYFLGSNPTVAARISQLDTVSAAIEIGRLSATVSAPQPKTETSAPAPITPVRASAASPKGADDLSPQEYRKRREAGQI